MSDVVRARRSALIAIALVTLGVARVAYANGDAASDYLYEGSLFPTLSSRPAPAVENQLRSVLEAAWDRGYPIKVALIARPSDLGLYTDWFDQPEKYVEYLSEEVSKGAPNRTLSAPVLVVSPYGLAVGGNERRARTLEQVTRGRAKELTAGIAAPKATNGNDLARTAITAVRRLAAAGGHRLPANVPPVVGGAPAPRTHRSGGSGLLLPAVVVVGTLLLGGLLLGIQRTAGRRRSAAADAPDEGGG